MQEIVEAVFLVIGAVVIFTLIYRAVPYKQWITKKPSFVFFPKYTAQFSRPQEDIISNIRKMGFELKPGSTNIYARGKAYGDFSAKVMKLHVEIDHEQRSIKVHAPFLGVLFDTGDLWSITSNILNGQ